MIPVSLMADPFIAPQHNKPAPSLGQEKKALSLNDIDGTIPVAMGFDEFEKERLAQVLGRI